MEKIAFAALFQAAVERALGQAGLPVGSEPLIEFHGAPNPPAPIAMEEAVNLLWLSPERFYRVVDVAAFEEESGSSTLFVRLSGHEPGSYNETWDPADLGPFRAIGLATRGMSGRSA